MAAYVKHFFGCTECAMHFGEMTVDKHMQNVSSHDEAILWLWRAHNTVNDRISGDVTDDPVFKKMKFPNYPVCPQCRPGFSFNENEVLVFLKKIHSDEEVNNFGIKTINPESLVSHANGRNGNFLSENFSSVVLIGVCVCILVVIALLFIPQKKRLSSRIEISTSNV